MNLFSPGTQKRGRENPVRNEILVKKNDTGLESRNGFRDF